MALKDIFNTLKNEGVLIPAIDSYLLTIGADNDRGHDYVSPSSVHSCIRSQLYRILGEQNDGANSPRLQRIFDVGTACHVMLQDYLTKAGVLKVPECPIFVPELKLAGHTDGILQLNAFTLGILEIKTINSDGFRNLREAKPEHVQQASAYMMGIEELRRKCAVKKLKYAIFKKKYLKDYADFMEGFVVTGHKFTKEQKMKMKMDLMESILDLMHDCVKPIDNIYFLYMNKDTQELKEFNVKWNQEEVDNVKNICLEVDKWRVKQELPPRPEGAVGKSCSTCRYCNYKDACFG